MKIVAVVACILLAVMMFAPLTTPVKATSPANTPTLQYIYYSDENALFSALVSGQIDSMQWPLTAAQYNSVLTNPGITVEPLSESGEFEIAFNNNITDGIHMDRRSPMNYTDFRNALNCLADVDGVIAGPTLGGFATHSYTQVPVPLGAAFNNGNVSGANYPWAFSVTNALTILWNAGWYNHAVYPLLQNLLDVQADGGLTGNLTGSGTGPYTGNANTAVYSGSDTNAKWDGGNAAANVGIQNTPLLPLQGYVRSADARKDLGDYFCNELKACGIPFTETYEPTLTALKPFVIIAQTYDFATLGYTIPLPPSWYLEVTAAGIFPSGQNPYLIQDWNITKYATLAFTDPTFAQYQADQLIVQYNLVMESYLIGGYCPATYCAYRTGTLGQVDILGMGTEANAAQWENWITLDTKKTPASSIYYMGLYSPPDMINPIFADTVFDFQISDEIFTYPIGANPYTIGIGSALTGAPTGNDVPWMAYSWKTEYVANPGGLDGIRYPGQWTNVTLYLRNDTTWQDGVPFTDLDINYTLFVNSVYGDAYDNGAMVWCVNNTGPFGNNTGATYAPYFQQDVTPLDPTGAYTCSILVKTTSWLALYYPLYSVMPYHLYKWIVPNSWTLAESGASKDGLHGEWPGEAAVAGNILAGAPANMTVANLNNKPEMTLVGTGPFMYRVGSTSATGFAIGGGITLDVYPKFFLTPAPGAIAFKPTWLDTTPADQPSGVYYKVGLSDLVYLAAAYGTTGSPPSTVPISEVPGAPHSWNPAADIAAPAGVVGLSDLVTLALHYNWIYGNYSYNAPYPPSEVANGGP